MSDFKLSCVFHVVDQFKKENLVHVRPMDAIDAFDFRSVRPAATPEQMTRKRRREEGVEHEQDWLLHPILIPTTVQATGTKEADVLPLDHKVAAAWQRQGHQTLFPVQRACLPFILEHGQRHSALSTWHDLLISAPTGSGKTLAYLLPLFSKWCRGDPYSAQLDTIVVLPNKDLARQVYKVATALFPPSTAGGPSIFLLGDTSFAKEKGLLVHPITKACGVHFLIATPGRLTDHLEVTPYFAENCRTVRHLVLDEADRLLSQSYNNFLPTLYRALQASSSPTEAVEGQPRWTFAYRAHTRLGSFDGLHDPVPLQKILLSATMTKHPSKLAALQLCSPRYIQAVHTTERQEEEETGELTIPDTLVQHYLVVPAAYKPLALMHLLFASDRVQRAICFAKSIDHARRLARLIHLFGERYRAVHPDARSLSCAFISSDVEPAKRQSLLAAFQAGKIDL